MSLATGTRLGPYEIVSCVGVGGMGEVYRARDTRLDRTVALKVLAAPVSGDARRLGRFRQEARAVSRLSHPYICTLHDVGEHEGTSFLVMEHVQGRTLASRLEEGPLPLDEVLRHGIQIAEALFAAHREGVIHRDLKPANVMLAREGIKLLDFGLARLKLPEERTDATTSITSDLTEDGVVLGTVPYMAPEQLQGKKADARTDIFALGIVLYEMVAGRRPFMADSQASLIAAILGSAPAPLSTSQPLAPPALEWTVRRCLAKDPDDRWQSARDVAAHLRWILEGGSTAGLPPSAEKARPRLAAVVAATLGALAAGTIVWSVMRPAPTTPGAPVRLGVALPPGVSLTLRSPRIPQAAIAVSPEGRRLVFAGTQAGTTRLYLRDLDAEEAIPLPGTEGASGPFFSPDGEWVGFWAGGTIKKVSPGGGAPIVLAAVPPRIAGATWSRDGTIFLSPQASGIWSLPAGGGEVQPLVMVDAGKGEKSHRWPHALPDGGALLFTLDIGRDFDEARIAALVPGSKEVKTVLEGGTAPRYMPSGHLVYALRGELLAAPFDRGRLEVTGPSVPLVKGVVSDPAQGVAHFDVSRTGTLAYVSGEAPRTTSMLVWVDRQGVGQPLPQPAREYGSPALSPDGRRLAVSLATTTTHDIWILDLERGTMARLTSDLGDDFQPVWTPDASRVAFASTRRGPPRIYWAAADGGSADEPFLPEQGSAPWELAQLPSSFSPDGRSLAFVEARRGGFDILVAPVAGDRRPQPVLVTPFEEGQPMFSPDGRFLAYVSNESGRSEVYVRPFGGSGTKWLVSTDGGDEPRWAPKGKELLYRSGRRVMAVEVRTAPSFQAGRPRLLFEGDYVAAGSAATRPRYDVSADGRRLLMVRESEAQGEPPRLNVVVNWLSDVQRRVPLPRR